MAAPRCLRSGCYLSIWTAGAEHGGEVLDEDLSEDVDGSQSAQRDRDVTRPHQIDPEYAGQVCWTHPVHKALLRHLRGATSVPNTITLFYFSGRCVSCPVCVDFT